MKNSESLSEQLPYERNKDRKDHRNGFRYRNFESRFGVIEDIPIPRAKKKSFFPSIFKRWKRRERKIVKIISDIFLRGLSTRKIKVVSKALWGREYSAATVSQFSKTLKEELLKWMNRKIEAPIKLNIAISRYAPVIRSKICLTSLFVSTTGSRLFCLALTAST